MVDKLVLEQVDNPTDRKGKNAEPSKGHQTADKADLDIEPPIIGFVVS